eukprot:TRINITY_DN11545_c0_g1_i1.p1 TRINITY_DN11545_c0_g1~~TRINITY_DN11545_c0_g1_i1.p1  ORF type:complete len:248 (+),score=37.05 TRINITY_DN11545_c0_g1_i1:170-913(+)
MLQNLAEDIERKVLILQQVCSTCTKEHILEVLRLEDYNTTKARIRLMISEKTKAEERAMMKPAKPKIGPSPFAALVASSNKGGKPQIRVKTPPVYSSQNDVDDYDHNEKKSHQQSNIDIKNKRQTRDNKRITTTVSPSATSPKINTVLRTVSPVVSHSFSRKQNRLSERGIMRLDSSSSRRSQFLQEFWNKDDEIEDPEEGVTLNRKRKYVQKDNLQQPKMKRVKTSLNITTTNGGKKTMLFGHKIK